MFCAFCGVQHSLSNCNFYSWRRVYLCFCLFETLSWLTRGFWEHQKRTKSDRILPPPTRGPSPNSVFSLHHRGGLPKINNTDASAAWRREPWGLHTSPQVFYGRWRPPWFLRSDQQHSSSHSLWTKTSTADQESIWHRDSQVTERRGDRIEARQGRRRFNVETQIDSGVRKEEPNP